MLQSDIRLIQMLVVCLKRLLLFLVAAVRFHCWDKALVALVLLMNSGFFTLMLPSISTLPVSAWVPFDVYERRIRSFVMMCLLLGSLPC